jgi:DnaJ-class molecular chaperone
MMPTCPTCNGKKIQEFSAKEIPELTDLLSFLTVPCYDCEGTGQVSHETFQKISIRNKVERKNINR